MFSSVNLEHLALNSCSVKYLQSKEDDGEVEEEIEER